METEILQASDAGWLKRAVEVISAGGLIAFPTDTVYGIGADPSQTGAVAALYEVKNRPPDKSIPILLGSIADLPKVAQRITAPAHALTQEFWPGALTIVLQKQTTIPEIVSSTGTIGIRIPDHPIALQLLQAIGPLAVTSANPSGELESRHAAEVMGRMGNKLDLIINGGSTPGGRPSTVVDCTIQPVRILRQGPISEESINSILGSR